MFSKLKSFLSPNLRRPADHPDAAAPPSKRKRDGEDLDDSASTMRDAGEAGRGDDLPSDPSQPQRSANPPASGPESFSFGLTRQQLQGPVGGQPSSSSPPPSHISLTSRVAQLKSDMLGGSLVGEAQQVDQGGASYPSAAAAAAGWASAHGGAQHAWAAAAAAPAAADPLNRLIFGGARVASTSSSLLHGGILDPAAAAAAPRPSQPLLPIPLESALKPRQLPFSSATPAAGGSALDQVWGQPPAPVLPAVSGSLRGEPRPSGVLHGARGVSGAARGAARETVRRLTRCFIYSHMPVSCIVSLVSCDFFLDPEMFPWICKFESCSPKQDEVT